MEPESLDALVAKNNTAPREYAERTLNKENVLSQFIADIWGMIMSQIKLYLVVMAGCSGSLLWSLSLIIVERLHQLNRLMENIILEPAGRNTAPSIVLAGVPY